MKKILKDFSRIYRLQDELLMGKTDFLIVKYRKGERLEMELKNGIMSTILAGEISIMCNHLWIRRSVKEGEMFLLLEKSFVSIEILEDTEAFLMHSSSLSKQGETLVLDKLSKLTPKINYNLDSLPACPQIMEIIRQINSYNKSGTMNDSLAFIKQHGAVLCIAFKLFRNRACFAVLPFGFEISQIQAFHTLQLPECEKCKRTHTDVPHKQEFVLRKVYGRVSYAHKGMDAAEEGGYDSSQGGKAGHNGETADNRV